MTESEPAQAIVLRNCVKPATEAVNTRPILEEGYVRVRVRVLPEATGARYQAPLTIAVQPPSD